MDDLLQQGITAYKAGKRDEARKIFITIVKQSPDSQSAWAWLYDVSNNDQERIQCLKQIVRINPNNEKAKQKLDSFTGQVFPLAPSQNATSPTQEQNNGISRNVQNKQPANPIKLATNKKTFITPSNILMFGAFACICIALPVFATMLNLTGFFKPTPVPISTPTNVPVVIDAMSLMGKSLDEIRSRYSVTDSLIDALPLDKDNSYADASYNEGYTDGKYDFEIVYDKNFRVNQVHLTIPYYTAPDLSYSMPSYKMSEWRAVMQMLNLNITYPPDKVVGTEENPSVYIWDNYNGYKIRINNSIQTGIILHAQVIKLK
jgi:tetratricopeptide (TPR) repeat protein